MDLSGASWSGFSRTGFAVVGPGLDVMGRFLTSHSLASSSIHLFRVKEDQKCVPMIFSEENQLLYASGDNPALCRFIL